MAIEMSQLTIHRTWSFFGRYAMSDFCRTQRNPVAGSHTINPIRAIPIGMLCQLDETVENVIRGVELAIFETKGRAGGSL